MNSYSLEQYEEDYARGEELWRGGHFAEALEDLSGTLGRRLAALAAATDAPAAPFEDDLELVERVADAAIVTGRSEAAADLLAAYVGMSRARGNQIACDYGTLKRIHLALERGAHYEADELLRGMEPSVGDVEAIEFTPASLKEWESRKGWPGAREPEHTVLLSLFYFVTGRLLAAYGQYEQALAAFRRGLRHARTDAPPLAALTRPRIRVAVAAARLEAGELEEARGLLEELRSELSGQQQPALYTRLLEMSAKLHLLKGEFGAALEELTHERDLCLQRGLVKGALLSSLNLAHLLIHLNLTNAARGMLTRVRELADASGERDVSAGALSLLWLVDERSHTAAGSVSAAPSLFNVRRRAAWGGAAPDADGGDDSTRGETGSYLALFELRVDELYRRLGRRDFKGMAARLAELEDVFGRSDSALVRLRLRVLRGVTAYYEGRVEQAEECLRELRPVLAELGLTPELWQLQRVLRWCQIRLGRPREEQHALADDTQRLLMSMADSLPAPYRAFFLLDKWTADEEYIAAQLDHLGHLRDGLGGGSRFRRPRRAWRLMRHLNALLSHIDRYKDALAESALEGREAKMVDEKGSGIPLWRRLIFHPLRRATVSFLVMPDRVLVISAGWMFLKFDIFDTTRLAVRELVQGWHLLVDGGGVKRNAAPPDDERRNLILPAGFKTSGAPRKKFDAAAARRELITRTSEALGLPSLLRTLPRRVRSLTIIPDDALHGFPFAAASYVGKHLIETYALTVNFKSDGWVRAAVPEGSRRALLVGVSHGAKSLVLPATGEELVVRPLPCAETEVNQLGEWFEGRGVRVGKLVNDGATQGAIVEGLATAAYVHIACHGFFAHERPDSSGLILIPAPGRAEVLSLMELSGLRLEGLRHISLSSCSSAENFILPGRWIISLPETLWRAGAQSVLGCMWEINDRFTASFMARFYWYLEKHPREEALRRTQVDCVRRASEGGGPRLDTESVDTQDPVNWASYSLYGDYRRLRL